MSSTALQKLKKLLYKNPGKIVTVEKTSKKTGLLDLPVELRLRIFTYAIRYHRSIKPIRFPWTQKFYVLKDMEDEEWSEFPVQHRTILKVIWNFVPATTAFYLSLTCRTFYREVTGENLFYKVNYFRFNNMYTLQQYINYLHPSRRQAIRQIIVFYSFRINPSAAVRSLMRCTSLQVLRLEISGMNLSRYRYIVREIAVSDIIDCDPFLKLRGLKSFRIIFTKLAFMDFLVDYCTYRSVPFNTDTLDNIIGKLRKFQTDVQKAATQPHEDMVGEDGEQSILNRSSTLLTLQDDYPREFQKKKKLSRRRHLVTAVRRRVRAGFRGVVFPRV